MDIPSHYRPRTPRGWLFLGVFAVLFALTQWPFLAWANRIEPLVFGLPFLYAYLTGILGLLILGQLFVRQAVSADLPTLLLFTGVALIVGAERTE